MDIIIGRDAATSQLRITVANQTRLFGNVGCVPNTVSRQHCKLTTNGGGSYTIENLKPQNETYVNGVAVIRKVINENDKIELGPARFLVSFDWINAVIPHTVDFRPLKNIWEEYDEHRLDQQIADRRFNALRGATGLITMAAIALSVVFPETRQTPLYIGLYILAIVVSLVFTLKAYKDASEVPHRMKEMEKQFKHDYVCPNCKHYLQWPYDVVTQNDVCPYCKAKIIK